MTVKEAAVSEALNAKAGRIVGMVLVLLGASAALAFGFGGATIYSSDSGSTIALPSTEVGTAGTAVAFTISGVSLTPADGLLTVTAPAHVEISADGASWGSSFTVAYTGAFLPSATVYVRLAEISSPGLYGGTVIISGGDADSVYQSASGTVTYVPEYASAEISILEAEPYLENDPITLRISNIVDQYGFPYDPQSIEYSFDGIIFISLTLTGAPLYSIEYTYANYGDKTIIVKIDSSNILTLGITVWYVPIYATATFQLTPNPSFLQNCPITASISSIKDQKNLDYVPTSSKIRFETSGGGLVYEESLGNCSGGCSATTTFNTPGNYIVRFDVDGSERDSEAFAILADTTDPTVTIEQAGSQVDPTNASPITFAVLFSEAVTGFETGDVTLSGTAGPTTDTVTETGPMDGTTYLVAVSGMTGDGTVIADIGSGAATDIAGNPNAASTSTDHTVTYDATAPTVRTVVNDTPLMTESDLTQHVTATFDEVMDTRVSPTITFSHGTLTSKHDGAWSAGDTVWTETFSLADHNEQIPVVNIEIAAAVDVAGNAIVPFIEQGAFAIDTGLPLERNTSRSLAVSVRIEDADPVLIWPINDEEAQPLGEHALCAVLASSTVTAFLVDIKDEQSCPVLDSWIHVFFYSVDLSTRPESLSLVTHWIVHCDREARNYPIGIDTSTLAPGYYDIRLVYPGGEPQDIRIQVTGK
ncbi:hypothetical protein KKG90_11525 [Candidatus Bipolaricaulota bacterium]|nr:hypothetical protein [Candidatus Bipolaricaulota bacterium]